MKKLFSFFTLLLLLTVGLTNNFTMVFAGQNNQVKIISNNKICNLDNTVNTKNSNGCIKICIYTNKSYFQNISKGNLLKKKKWNNSLYWCNNIFNLTYFDSINLIIKKHSPYFTKNINYYSYHNLVKIIKSNI